MDRTAGTVAREESFQGGDGMRMENLVEVDSGDVQKHDRGGGGVSSELDGITARHSRNWVRNFDP